MGDAALSIPPARPTPTRRAVLAGGVALTAVPDAKIMPPIGMAKGAPVRDPVVDLWSRYMALEADVEAAWTLVEAAKARLPGWAREAGWPVWTDAMIAEHRLPEAWTQPGLAELVRLHRERLWHCPIGDNAARMQCVMEHRARARAWIARVREQRQLRNVAGIPELVAQAEALWDRRSAIEAEILRTRPLTVPGVVCKLLVWRDNLDGLDEDGAGFTDDIVLSVLADLQAGVATGASSLPLNAAGDDVRFLAWEAELAELLGRRFEVDEPSTHHRRVDALERLIAWTPASGHVGALVKLRRLVCPQLGLFACGHRTEGDTEAMIRDVLRVIAAHVADGADG
ncbi:hypothetical protein [Azospirillum largimobile]